MHVRKHFYSSGLKKSVLGTKFPDAFSCHFASSLGLDDHLLPLLGGIPLGCGLDDRGVEFRHGLENFSSPPHSDRLWGPPSILSNGYKRLFPCGV